MGGLAGPFQARIAGCTQLGLRGQQAADAALIETIQKRGITIEWVDECHPDWAEWEASQTWGESVDGTRTIRLRRNPRHIEILEEYLHQVQDQIGLDLPYPVCELHVKDYMIRHKAFLGISDADAMVLRQRIFNQMKSKFDINGALLKLPPCVGGEF